MSHPSACLKRQKSRIQRKISAGATVAPDAKMACLKRNKDPDYQYVGLNLSDRFYYCQLSGDLKLKIELPTIPSVDPIYTMKDGLSSKKVVQFMDQESAPLLKFLYQVYFDSHQMGNRDLTHANPILQLLEENESKNNRAKASSKALAEASDLSFRHETKGTYNIYRYVNEKNEVVENDGKTDLVRTIYDGLIVCLNRLSKQLCTGLYENSHHISYAHSMRGSIYHKLRTALKGTYESLEDFRELIDKHYGLYFFDQLCQGDLDRDTLTKEILNYYWRSYEKEYSLLEFSTDKVRGEDVDRSVQSQVIGLNMFITHCCASKDRFLAFKKAFIEEILHPMDPLPPTLPPWPAEDLLLLPPLVPPPYPPEDLLPPLPHLPEDLLPEIPPPLPPLPEDLFPEIPPAVPSRSKPDKEILSKD